MKNRLIKYSIYFTIVILIQIIANLMKQNIEKLWYVAIVLVGFYILAVTFASIGFSPNEHQQRSMNGAKGKQVSLGEALLSLGLLIPIFINLAYL